MGCDIHIEVFVRDSKGEIKFVQRPLEYTWNQVSREYRDWSLDPRWPNWRDYATFSLLAGVRGEPGSFFIAPRGLPDFWPEDNIWKVDRDYRFGVHEREELDSGDHSHTWMTLAEIRRLPWLEYRYAPAEPQFLKVFVPMLELLERTGFSENDIIVTMGFDS